MSCPDDALDTVKRFSLCPVVSLLLGTFRSDYEHEYEYEFFNVYPARMPDRVRLSRQLVLSSKSRRRLDTNYEILNKSLPPTTSLLQVQRRVKRLVFKRVDTLEMFRATCLAMFWRLCGILCCLSTKYSCDRQNVITSYSQKLLKYFCCELTTATTVSTTAKTQASRAQKSYSYS